MPLDLPAAGADGNHPVNCLRRAAVLAALLAPLAAGAQAPVPLERCLAQFEGIQWKLPYRPYMHVYRCVGPDGGFNSGPGAPGVRRIEFIGDSTITPPRQGMPAENFGEMQQAVFAHFDKLFQRHGFQRTELQENVDHSPAYPKLAKYRRFTGAGPLTLTWQTMAANTWVVTLEPAGAAR
jgi:hypothetical protein